MLVFSLALLLLQLYSYCFIAFCVMSFFPQIWQHPIGYKIARFLCKICIPATNFVQQFIPAKYLRIGMFDLTPIIILLGIDVLSFLLRAFLEVIFRAIG